MVDNGKTIKDKIIYSLKIFLGCSLFIFIISKLFTPESWSILTQFKVRDFFIIWVFTILINIIASFRWYLLLQSMNVRSITYLYILRVAVYARFSGQAFSQIVGDVGVKTLYLNGKISMQNIAKSIIWDKLFEVILLVLVFLMLVFQISYPKINHASIFMIPFFILILVLGSTLINFIAEHVSGYRLKWIPDFTLSLTFTQKLSISALSLLKYGFVVLRYMILLLAFNISLGYYDVFSGTAFAQIGNLLGITPGGIGLVEAGWLGVLRFHSIEAGKIAVFLLAQRVAILLAVLLNFLVMTICTKIIIKDIE